MVFESLWHMHPIIQEFGALHIQCQGLHYNRWCCNYCYMLLINPSMYKAKAKKGNETYSCKVCYSLNEDTVLCRVKLENWAVLGIRAPCEAGSQCWTWIPRTAPFKFLTQHKEPKEFCLYKWMAVIHLKGTLHFKNMGKVPFTCTRKNLPDLFGFFYYLCLYRHSRIDSSHDFQKCNWNISHMFI